jgi:hypothetical protein
MAPAASLAAARSLTAALSSSTTARASSDKVGIAAPVFNFVEFSFFMQGLCFCARWWVFGLSSTLFFQPFYHLFSSLFFGDVRLEYSLKGFFALVLTYSA